MQVGEIRVKSILTPSKLPESDYVINPYVGCRFGCTYCYASFMGRFVGKTVADWGEYVYAKINAPDLLKKDVQRLKDKGKGKIILLSSVTDPFQGIEEKYRLSEKCLTVLVDYGFAGTVSILTKSPLVLEVLPILKRLKDVDVGLTITTTDDKISRYFEKYAPPASTRIKTLKKLNEEGIRTYAFFGPLLPHFVANKIEIKKVLDAIYKSGTRRLFIEHINLPKYVKERMFKEIKGVGKSVLKEFYSSQSKSYREELNKMIYLLLARYNFTLLHGEIIYHKELSHI